MSANSQEAAIDLGTLLHRACREQRRTWREQLSPWDLSPFQWRALRRIAGTKGGVRPSALSDELHIARRSVTEVVDQLQAKGLVQRTSDPTDRRATLVEATGAGADLTADIRSQRRAHNEQYFGKLSLQQQGELGDLLALLVGEGG